MPRLARTAELARGLIWIGGVVGWVTAFSTARHGPVVYMPEAIDRSATHYGPIGIAIALVSWLVGIGFALTICAAVGAVLGEALAAPDDGVSER